MIALLSGIRLVNILSSRLVLMVRHPCLDNVTVK